MNPKLLQAITEKKVLDDALKADMDRTIKEFKQNFLSARQLAGARV